MRATDQTTHDSSITRRQFSGMAASGMAAIASLGWAGTAAAEGASPFRATRRGRGARPNIVFIMADDLGWGDVSCYGSPLNDTPNIDQLARQGVRFTEAYSSSPTCSPTRFALYSGRFPGRLRGGLQEPIGVPSPYDGMPSDFPTVARLLGAAGYDTAMVGKWHCGYLPWFGPLRCGWDEFFGIMGGACDYLSHVGVVGVAGNELVFGTDLVEGEATVEDVGYLTTMLGERAAEYVQRDHDRPYLLNLNFTAPHYPWEGPTDQAESDRITARLVAGDLSALFHNDGGSLDVYRAMVESMDDAIGRVLDAIDRSGSRRETIVIFTSDNGGERFSYQWPFSGSKSTLREGGLRVPCIIRWPGRISRNQVSDAPLVTHDLTATLLDVGGGQPDPAYPLDGVSLAGFLLDGDRTPDRDIFWRIRAERTLRRGDWKYYRGPDPSPLPLGPPVIDFLFHLPTDSLEQANLATQEPGVLAELKATWESIDAGLLAYPPPVTAT